jgi:hypothetical protein
VTPLSTETRTALTTALASNSLRSVSRQLHVSHETLRKAAAGAPVSAATVAKLDRIVDRRRTADEFKATSSASVEAPRRSLSVFSWSLETIRAARDAQMRGDFKQAAALADAMKTDDALFVAYHNRIAPQNAVKIRLDPARESARARAVHAKAIQSCIVARDVLAGINGTLADHAIAFGYVRQETSEDGMRVDFRLEEWPIEFVRWDASRKILVTQTKDGPQETINHGDGRWIVFRKQKRDPWRRSDAAVLPGALCWAAHAYGLTDWASTARSHGQAKIVGTLPEGNALRDADGNLTPMGRDFLAMIQGLVSGEMGGGLAPFGAKVDFLANGSTAWQVFDSLIVNREKAAARIYLGTDAILGSVGGAPGVDISALFGVATTKIQGDFDAIEQGLNVGLYQPWCAINEGDSRYAPTFHYELPDPDAARKAEERANALDRFNSTIKQYRDNGFEIEQDTVDRVARDCGVENPPKLAAVAGPAVKPNLAPTDVYKILTVNEMRASQGLPPLPGPEGKLFGGQFDAKNDANSAAPAAPPAPAP